MVAPAIWTIETQEPHSRSHRSKTSRELLVQGIALLVAVHPDRHRGAGPKCRQIPSLSKFHAHLRDLLSPVCEIGAAHKCDHPGISPSTIGPPTLRISISWIAPLPVRIINFSFIVRFAEAAINQRVHRDLFVQAARACHSRRRSRTGRRAVTGHLEPAAFIACGI